MEEKHIHYCDTCEKETDHTAGYKLICKVCNERNRMAESGECQCEECDCRFVMECENNHCDCGEDCQCFGEEEDDEEEEEEEDDEEEEN